AAHQPGGVPAQADAVTEAREDALQRIAHRFLLAEALLGDRSRRRTGTDRRDPRLDDGDRRLEGVDLLIGRAPDRLRARHSEIIPARDAGEAEPQPFAIGQPVSRAPGREIAAEQSRGLAAGPRRHERVVEYAAGAVQHALTRGDDVAMRGAG